MEGGSQGRYKKAEGFFSSCKSGRIYNFNKITRRSGKAVFNIMQGI